MIMDYKYVPKDERLKAKEGFEMLCLPKDKKPDGDCGAPIQVKKNMDKAEIERSVEKKLDQKIAGGVGATKWGKVLDWVLPIFALGLGVAVIDHAINGDVSDFFDEIAFDALIDAGGVENVDVTGGTDAVFSFSKSTFVTNHNGRYHSITMAYKDPKLAGTYEYWNVNSESWSNLSQGHYYFNFFVTVNTTDTKGYISSISGIGYPTTATHISLPGDTWYDVDKNNPFVDSVFKKPITRKIGGGVVSKPTVSHGETGLPRTNPEKKAIPIITPAAVPLIDIGTGKPVVPYTKPDGTTGYTSGVNPTTGAQIDVDESSVSVGNPAITQNPDGSETVTPAPTPQNPTPKPDDGATKPPPLDPENPLEFPEGETCSTTLKLPKIGLLVNSLSKSFPFSIPWDLKSGFDALFSEMGKDKPKFNYKFEFNGSQKEWKVELPEYFDNWKPFTDSVLIFVFDVGILYGIYRLIQGGGS